MISRIQQPVLKASETQWLISGGAARWRFAARAIGMAAAFAVTAALTGCGASASHQADVQAQAATSRASILLAHAGMYHPKANFPITISAPLSPGQLIADKDAAKGNPGAYLQSPSLISHCVSEALRTGCCILEITSTPAVAQPPHFRKSTVFVPPLRPGVN